MTSSEKNKEAFVWIWLPKETKPVVAGKIVEENNYYIFNYGKSYLERENAIPIYDKELPLIPGRITPLKGLTIPNCIRDAAPDAWGRRVIISKLFGRKNIQIDNMELNELTYLLLSGSDRIGALDFQYSPTNYELRSSANANLSELLELAERVEQKLPLTPELEQVLYHGSSIGGARPKALIDSKNNKEFLAISTTIDVKNCDQSIIKSAANIQDYVIQLCKLIEMERVGDCQITIFGKDNDDYSGFTMVQLIQTSLISAHFNTMTNTAYIDIFSTKVYNANLACKFTLDFFKGEESEYKVHIRK